MAQYACGVIIIMVCVCGVPVVSLTARVTARMRVTGLSGLLGS